MRLIKKINTSAAIALDSTGHEVVVLGKGIGFPPMPYELDDLSRIQRTFYDVDPKYLEIIAQLPQPVLMASAEIAEEAEISLGCQLNANLPFTLADHLNFAHQRQEHGVDLTLPIAYDIQHLYPREYELGLQALQILFQQAGISLPESEAIHVAMHLINAEADTGDMHSLMMTMQILSEIGHIVETQLQMQIDFKSYYYSRFITHLRYLIQRLQSGTQCMERGSSMLPALSQYYPDIYHCAQKVTEYLSQTWGWTCNKEETVYLMMHLYRLKERK